jgi:uncharacterized protein YdeI (YjbR/CyaY-like superfamily)
MPRPDAPEVLVDGMPALQAWLAAHHDQRDGVWLVYYKKAAGDRAIAYPDIVRACLAWGWIDSLPRRKDDLRAMLWIAPRRPGAAWSAVNKAHVDALLAQDLMKPPGQAAVDRARADGSWDVLNAVEAGELPDDLALALDQSGARTVWDGWPRSVTRGALEILLNAKRPETRAARIATILQAAARGERPFQWTGRKGGTGPAA